MPPFDDPFLLDSCQSGDSRFEWFMLVQKNNCGDSSTPNHRFMQMTPTSLNGRRFWRRPVMAKPKLSWRYFLFVAFLIRTPLIRHFPFGSFKLHVTTTGLGSYYGQRTTLRSNTFLTLLLFEMGTFLNIKFKGKQWFLQTSALTTCFHLLFSKTWFIDQLVAGNFRQ